MENFLKVFADIHRINDTNQICELHEQHTNAILIFFQVVIHKFFSDAYPATIEDLRESRQYCTTLVTVLLVTRAYLQV
jgi:hypothetical protein